MDMSMIRRISSRVDFISPTLPLKGAYFVLRHGRQASVRFGPILTQGIRGILVARLISTI